MRNLSLFVCRYHNGDAYIIDVSQSVEHDHPHALEFLRKDCSNVNGEAEAQVFPPSCFLVVFYKQVVFFYPEFFVKHGVAVMTVRELFDFITDPSITCQNMDQYLEKV